jgi:hypothetical protein
MLKMRLKKRHHAGLWQVKLFLVALATKDVMANLHQASGSGKSGVASAN